LLQVVIGRIDVGVGQTQEQIDTVELDTIHLGGGGQVQHGVEVDGRLGVGALADQARPHRIMQRGA